MRRENLELTEKVSMLEEDYKKAINDITNLKDTCNSFETERFDSAAKLSSMHKNLSDALNRNDQLSKANECARFSITEKARIM